MREGKVYMRTCVTSRCLYLYALYTFGANEKKKGGVGGGVFIMCVRDIDVA